jgi:hypothetical protein
MCADEHDPAAALRAAQPADHDQARTMLNMWAHRGTLSDTDVERAIGAYFAEDAWDVAPKPATISLLAEMAADPDVPLRQLAPGVYWGWQ